MFTQKVDQSISLRCFIVPTVALLMATLAIMIVSSGVAHASVVAQRSGCDSSVVVEPGDTLSDIARRSGTSTTHLRDCNDLDNDGVEAGQRLRTPREAEPRGSSVQDSRRPRMDHSDTSSRSRYGRDSGSQRQRSNRSP